MLLFDVESWFALNVVRGVATRASQRRTTIADTQRNTREMLSGCVRHATAKNTALMPKKRRPKAAYLHQLWSQCVRERDDYTCQSCHRNFRHDPASLHASHHIARGMGGGSPYLKYSLLNGAALCAVPGKHKKGCHQYLDGHPLEHGVWIESFLGSEGWETLRELDRTSQDRPRWTDSDFRDLAKELREQLKAYRERRAQGERGQL